MYKRQAVVRAGDRSAQSGYSYRLDFGLGSNHAKNIDFFDSIEQGARLASHKPGQEEQWIPSQWQGRFLFVDTSYAESMKLIPTVYYSTDEKQELRADADGWRKERPKDPGDVKAVWILSLIHIYAAAALRGKGTAWAAAALFGMHVFGIMLDMPEIQKD